MVAKMAAPRLETGIWEAVGRDALEGGEVPPPPPSRAPGLCPATPASMAFVTDSNRSQPLW